MRKKDTFSNDVANSTQSRPALSDIANASLILLGGTLTPWRSTYSPCRIVSNDVIWPVSKIIKICPF